MEKIYLLKNDKIMIGPFSIEKLREKNLKPSDLVWYEGLKDWTPAGNILQLTNTEKEKMPVDTKTRATIKGFFKRLFAVK